ncbi:hypothetical protein JKF63_00282 [Porcisia hertigi]|uniref:Uncharacterized protein n=1 Tax=Porcisia hertigi TaxID=2761500 RepID=A0A836L6Q2_9TRYP|nr:hypothetical protein JKF63_00282 [Porcisia hertigi]
MFFIYPTPQYPRQVLEAVFKSLYMLANLAHMVSLVILISEFYTRLISSMPSYYTSRDLVLSDSVVMVMENCIYRGSIHLGNVRGTVEVTAGNIGYGFMTTAQYVTALFVLEFLLLVNNMLIAMNYVSGNRHIRIFSVHVPLYHITVTLTQMYSVAIVVCVWSFDGNRRFFQRALEYCAEQLRQSHHEQLLASEFDGYTIFSTPVYWPFAATCVSEFIYLLGVIVLCYFSSDEATVLLSEADSPWEMRGVLCKTSKPLLKLHTAQRNAIIEDTRNAIKEGQKVRIVRSYQLITEEAFEALVQAMREQVARALKEKQFEQLKKTFGDDDSKLENMGFTWRGDLMDAPLDVRGDSGDALDAGVESGPADQFFNVPFEDYFTDNGASNISFGHPGERGGAVGETGAVYSDKPFLIHEGGLGGDDGVGGGGGIHGDGNGVVTLGLADDGGAAQDTWSPQEVAHVMDGVGETHHPSQLQSHTQHQSRRRHRHGRTSDTREDNDYRVEPDPRMPSQQQQRDYGRNDLDDGDADGNPPNYYYANNDMMYVASDTGGGGTGHPSSTGRGTRLDSTNSNYPPNRRGSRQRRQGRGRQAALEQEDDVADELSDELA